MQWYGDADGAPPPDAGAGVAEALDALARGRLPPRLRREILGAFGVDLGDPGAAPSTVFVRGCPTVASLRLAGWLGALVHSAGPRPAAAPPDYHHPPALAWRAPHRDADPDAIDRLIRWLAGGGAELPSLAVRAGDAGRAVHATRPIAQGERVLFVPRGLIISSLLARASTIGRAIDRADVRLDSNHSLLAAWLAVERRDPRSPWRPYLDALPTDFPALPAVYSRAELEWLRGSLALTRVERQLASLARDLAALGALPAFASIDAGEFTWARLVVMTRVFAIQLGGADVRALVPMADLLNHDRVRETSWGYHDAGDGFEIRALTSFAAGQELHDSYGGKCNSRYFANYGFFIPDNPDDEAALHLPPPADPRADLAARLLWGHPLGATSAFRVPARHDHPWTRRMLSFLRLSCADGAELAGAARAQPRGDLAWIGPRNELAALAALARAARASLGRFATRSTAEDDRILADPQLALAPRLRLCVQVRRAEKRVLEAFVALAEQAAPILAAGPPPTWRRAAEEPGASPLLAGHLAAAASAAGSQAGLPPAGAQI